MIWVPKVRGRATDIAEAAGTVPDVRMQHFWDGRGRLMNAYQEVLGLSEDAWDVYLVYAPGARWDDELPPTPRMWMHQLGTRQRPRVRGRYLDPMVFATEVRAILHASPPLAAPAPPGA